MVMTDKRPEFYFVIWMFLQGKQGKEISSIRPGFHFCVSLRKIEQMWAMNALVLALTRYM